MSSQSDSQRSQQTLYSHAYMRVTFYYLCFYTWNKRTMKSWWLPSHESANFRFLQRLSVIFGLHRDCPWSPASCRDYHPPKMASCRDCLCDSASCQDSQQEADSHGQSLQEAIYQVQQSGQEATDHGQSRRKPNMTDSLCRNWKLADSFIPCAPELWDCRDMNFSDIHF